MAQQVLGHQPRLDVVRMLDIGSSEWVSMKQEDVEADRRGGEHLQSHHGNCHQPEIRLG